MSLRVGTIGVLFVLIWWAEGAYKTANTENGRVRGFTSKTLFDQRVIVNFLGIPYAKPPIGQRRFEVCVRLIAIRLEFLSDFVFCSEPKSHVVGRVSWTLCNSALRVSNWKMDRRSVMRTACISTSSRQASNENRMKFGAEFDWIPLRRFDI